MNILNKGFANNQPMCDILYIYYLEIIYQFQLVLATRGSYPHGMPPYAMCIPSGHVIKYDMCVGQVIPHDAMPLCLAGEADGHPPQGHHKRDLFARHL